MAPGPAAFREAFHASDHDVRAKTTNVTAELRHGAVGGDEEREDVEALDAVVGDQFRVLPRRLPHPCESLG